MGTNKVVVIVGFRMKKDAVLVIHWQNCLLSKMAPSKFSFLVYMTTGLILAVEVFVVVII